MKKSLGEKEKLSLAFLKGQGGGVRKVREN